MRSLDPQSLTKHVDRLYRAAWALCGSREDAEDLVQETFARVLSKPRYLHGGEDEEIHYLMRALRNMFFSTRRSAARRPLVVAEVDELTVSDPRASDRPGEALQMRELYAAIAALPEDFRLALVAVDIVGLSYKEASELLDVREATITTRLFRARKSLVRAFADDETHEQPSRNGQPELDQGPRQRKHDRQAREGKAAAGRLIEERQR
ncbi:MAG TPA: RNA polymerase sigma factor [Solirubrobacteraceae bacterium]